MIPAGCVSVERVAYRLDCPVRFVMLLQEHGILPASHGEGVDVRELKKAIRLHPWLKLLSTPLSVPEFNRLIGPIVRYPDDVGLRTAGGRRMARPWQVMMRAWGASSVS